MRPETLKLIGIAVAVIVGITVGIMSFYGW